jgi:hypothetical protein
MGVPFCVHVATEIEGADAEDRGRVDRGSHRNEVVLDKVDEHLGAGVGFG